MGSRFTRPGLQHRFTACITLINEFLIKKFQVAQNEHEFNIRYLLFYILTINKIKNRRPKTRLGPWVVKQKQKKFGPRLCALAVVVISACRGGGSRVWTRRGGRDGDGSGDGSGDGGAGVVIGPVQRVRLAGVGNGLIRCHWP